MGTGVYTHWILYALIHAYSDYRTGRQEGRSICAPTEEWMLCHFLSKSSTTLAYSFVPIHWSLAFIRFSDIGVRLPWYSWFGLNGEGLQEPAKGLGPRIIESAKSLRCNQYQMSTWLHQFYNHHSVRHFLGVWSALSLIPNFPAIFSLLILFIHLMDRLHVLSLNPYIKPFLHRICGMWSVLLNNLCFLSSHKNETMYRPAGIIYLDDFRSLCSARHCQESCDGSGKMQSLFTIMRVLCWLNSLFMLMFMVIVIHLCLSFCYLYTFHVRFFCYPRRTVVLRCLSQGYRESVREGLNISEGRRGKRKRSRPRKRGEWCLSM